MKFKRGCLSDGIDISSLLGLSLTADLSSGSGPRCSSVGACYSPGSAAAPEGSGTPSDPGAEHKYTCYTYMRHQGF